MAWDQDRWADNGGYRRTPPREALATFAALRRSNLAYVGRLSTAASLQTGYAFNHGRANGEMPRAFEVSTGAVSLSVDNSPIVRPQVDAEYFVTSKFTLRVSADYMMLRPAIAVTTPTERIVGRWHASNVHANVGVGFYPMRK